MENLGKQTAIIRTVFRYKAHVAIAATMLFITLQGLVLWLIAVSLVYFILALNRYLTTIFIYESGLIIKSLFRKTIIHESKIAQATFRRMGLTKIIISISIADARDVSINSSKYDNPTPLIEFLKRFKAEDK